MTCFHEIVYIDHHGRSCGLCGIALEGYGVSSPFRGKQDEPEHCLHGRTAWRSINETHEQCVYCSLIITKVERLRQMESPRFPELPKLQFDK